MDYNDVNTIKRLAKQLGVTFKSADFNVLGEVAATLLSRLAVPVVYYLIARRGRAEELRQEGLTPAVSA